MVVDRELRKLLTSITEEDEEYTEELEYFDQANDRRMFTDKLNGPATEPRARHSRTKTGNYPSPNTYNAYRKSDND